MCKIKCEEKCALIIDISILKKGNIWKFKKDEWLQSVSFNISIATILSNGGPSLEYLSMCENY